MKSNLAINVENVSKKYCKSLKRSMLYGMSDIGRNLLGLNSHPGTLRQDEFWAVDDVSFEIERGETFGLVGPNGSGKTTLLKMLNGIFWPDKGRITVNGRVGALIAVGAGFHPLLSGRENIYVNGAILGMSRREMDRKFDAIVDFADIGDFLDAPVKSYSSGMHVRLGFAIAVHADCNILLVDEILAVGDINFQAKCMDKIREIRGRGVSVVFVSHNLNAVQMLCDRALYLQRGSTRYTGKVVDVLNEFKKDSLRGARVAGTPGRYGTQDVEITNVVFLNKDNVAAETFRRGDPLQITIRFRTTKTLRDPHFTVGFETLDGTLLCFANTKDHGVTIDLLSGSGEVTYRIESIPFNIGRYLVSLGCWDASGQVAYDHFKNMHEILVEDGLIGGKVRERFGLVHVPAAWNLSKCSGPSQTLQ